MRLVIMTDLDGCVLDPGTYDYKTVLPLVERLKKQGIEIIFNSSKTRLEQLLYIKRLGLQDIVFIVENGAAIYIPKKKAVEESINDKGCFDKDEYYVCVLGKTIDEIKKTINDIINDYRDYIMWMDEITPELFTELTGLPVDESVLALKREYSYLFIPKTEDKSIINEVVEKIKERGLNIQISGVGISQINGKHDKGKALQLLRNLLKEYREAHIIAVGDAMNDASMLRVADTGVLLGVNPDVIARVGRYDLVIMNSKGSHAWRNALARLTGNYDLVVRG